MGEFREANPGGQGLGALKGPPRGEGGSPKGAPFLWPPEFVFPKLPLSPPPGCLLKIHPVPFTKG